MITYYMERAKIVGDFLDVVRIADGKTCFPVEEVNECRLRAFDLRVSRASLLMAL